MSAHCAENRNEIYLLLKTIQSYDEYHLNEQIEDIKTEIENIYFDSGIANKHIVLDVKKE